MASDAAFTTRTLRRRRVRPEPMRISGRGSSAAQAGCEAAVQNPAAISNSLKSQAQQRGPCVSHADRYVYCSQVMFLTQVLLVGKHEAVALAIIHV